VVAIARFPEWVAKDKHNLVQSTQGIKLCIEGFVSAVAAGGSFDSCAFVQTSPVFRTPEFIEFKQLVGTLMKEHEESKLGMARKAIGECSALGGAFLPVANAIDRLLDCALPIRSHASPLNADAEQPAGTNAGSLGETLSPIGLPPMNVWPLTGPPPKWAYVFDFVSFIKQCTTVAALCVLYKTTLKPLELRYGASAAGVVRGQSWRGPAHRGASATTAWWTYQPLFAIFDGADANIDACQSQIDM
jgi:hypothetical protein